MKNLRLHRPNLLAVLCSACPLMLGPLPCDANLGDTPEQIKARYGEVVDKFGEGTEKTFRFRRPGLERDTVDVTFQNGKCQCERYYHWKSAALAEIDSTGSYSKAEIEFILKANAQGLTWRKQPPNWKDPPATTTWLLGSNDPKTALAKAVSNDESHSAALWLLEYDFFKEHTDVATAARIDALFPALAKTPEPVRVPIPLKPGVLPILKILGESQATVTKVLGKPSNYQPIHKPDKFAGGMEVQYPDGTNWKFLDTAFYRDKLSWIYFLFPKPLPASENELFDVLGLSKTAFRKTSENSRQTEYRGVADKRVLKIVASHPGPRDGVGFCVTVDIELIESLD